MRARLRTCGQEKNKSGVKCLRGDMRTGYMGEIRHTFEGRSCGRSGVTKYERGRIHACEGEDIWARVRLRVYT